MHKSNSLFILLFSLLVTSCGVNNTNSSQSNSSFKESTDKNITNSKVSSNSFGSDSSIKDSSSSLENDKDSSIKDSSSSNNESEDDLNGKTIFVNNKKDIDQNRFYNEFYNYTSDIEITLNFTNKSIYKLADYSDDDNKRDMYHPCDMEIKMNETTYIFNEVGARMKGNTSRNAKFVNESGKFSAPVHFKISVNQTFDNAEDNDYYTHTWDNSSLRDERKKRRIGDSKKFDIKYNKNQDNTFTKQIYAYHCYEEENLVSQKNNLIKVNINSESDSMTHLYELQECIDSEFIERRFSEEEIDGNLYKCTYTNKGPADLTHTKNDVVGIEKGSYHPVYDLKTNEKEANFSDIKNLITTLNNDTSKASEFKNTFDSLVNAEEFIKFAALSWVIGNPDDIRNNSNNYYIYFNSNDKRATFIPYDFDRCFGILKDWEIHMENIPHYTTKQNTGSRNWQKNPIFWRTIISTTDQSVDYSKKYEVIKEYQEMYNDLCLEYANKYLNVDKYKEFNDQFVYSNKDINEGGANNLTFKEYCDAKLKTFNK